MKLLPHLAVFFILATAHNASSAHAPTGVRSVGLTKNGQAAKPGKNAIRFENTIRQSSVRFVLNNSVSPQRYSIETMLGGVAVFDYNNDGLLDIFFTNGAAIPSLDKSDASYSNRLYRNNGDGTFTDVTAKAGLSGTGYSMGVAVGDYDNDGWEDLYVAGYDRNHLYRNNGNGTFTDVTTKAGVSGISHGVKPWAVAAGWFDYDRDGRLDLIVANYLDYDLKTAAHCQSEGHPAYCTPDGFAGTANILYHNNGDGTFTDVSDTSRISRYVGKAMGVAIADYDGDGYPDIFISNDTFQNFLLHNNGDSTFTDVALEAGAAFTGSGALVAGMGADFRDLDNDGRPDIFHTAMFGNTFPLYHNLGGGAFEDVTGSSGLATATKRLTAWGTGIYDFDNDGLKDLFIAGGEILDNSEQIVHRPAALPDMVFRNLGGLRFSAVPTGGGGIRRSIEALPSGI
jgi:enediyne biosynthesis protein E4